MSDNVVHEMRQSTAAQVKVNVGLTSTPLVAQSDKRVALVIGAPLTNRITLSWFNPAVLDEGITIYPTQWPVILTLQDVGAMIMNPIWAVSAVAAQDVNFIEVQTTCKCKE
jgi:hypothetical protein